MKEFQSNNGVSTGKCPFMHGSSTVPTTSPLKWWPKRLNLDIFINTMKSKSIFTISTTERVKTRFYLWKMARINDNPQSCGLLTGDIMVA